MTSAPAVRPIDTRSRPAVGGIDLVQALNYLALDEAGEGFIYDHYTNSKLAYTAGRRPALEEIVTRLRIGSAAPAAKVQAIATFVAEKVPWAGFYERDIGTTLRGDRALDEEGIVASGYGWCNEQARVFCVLTQVAGLASRLVFAGNPKAGYGHVIAEVLLPEGWLAADQSFGFLFLHGDRPVRAVDIYREPACRAFFSPRYRAVCAKLIAALGTECLSHSFTMALAEDPLDGFQGLGYCNHFAI
ncbi:MAG: transglutaminase-like domain-containing protein [Kiritimatiellae bacterium]|nr:transglutaminase-like domain-containing protein [Kiritimatiellia bacterium]